ncbi:MAG: alpha-xenorhabdolysin family binary toxin subunit A [Pseudomonadota bacterium]
MTTMPTVATSLVPPSGLVVQNPAGGAAPTLFCMFSQDWITLQTFIAQAMQLPINQGDFGSKYGTFVDMKAVEDCVAAMKSVQDLSKSFGDPTALVKQLATNPAILQTDTAPDQLYVHIVWFATRLYQTATTFNQTLGQLMTILNAVPAKDLPATLQSILTGPGGLQSSAASMVTLANDLIAKLAQFNVALTPATNVMADYTGRSSKFYQDVIAEVGQDAADVETFQHEADVAYKLWRDLTISAVTTSIGVMVLSGGLAWPASAVLAGVLGDQAQKARDAYDKACGERDDAAADKQKKMALQNDLGAFNTQMTPTNQAAANFLTTLQKVTGVWTNIGSDLDYIAKNFTPDQFAGLPAWKDAMMLDRATQDWQVIAGKASDYTANSLVTFNVGKFGDKVAPAA